MEPLPSTSSHEINSTSLLPSKTEILDPCAYTSPPYLEERFWLVSVFGTSVSIISILENMFLFFMLCRSRQHRNSHSLYLLLLALCDIFIAAAYIPLMSFSLLLDYFESLLLLRAWFTYMIPMITSKLVFGDSESRLFLNFAIRSETRILELQKSGIRLQRTTRNKLQNPEFPNQESLTTLGPL